MILASVKQHHFYANLCPAIQQQRLRSTPRFGVLKAYQFTHFLLRRSVFPKTPASSAVVHVPAKKQHSSG